MFDKNLPNVILLSDKTDVITMSKTLGPYKVAHALRSQGFEVAVLHHLSVFTIEEICHILRNLISDKTLFVGVNNFFYADISNPNRSENGGVILQNIEPGCILPHGLQYNETIKNLIRECNPNCKLTLGGPTARDVGYNKIFDYQCIGYSEISIVNLAQHLYDTNIDLQKSHKSVHGPIIIDDSRAETYDFNQCQMRYEDHDVILPGETLMLEVARGCIFKCAFCSYPMNGKKKLDFIRNMDYIYEELVDNYERFGITRYMFSDDTVNDSPEKCQMIYDMSKRLPFKLEWWGYLRLDLLTAHPETVDWLFESGLRSAWFGIETLDPKTASIIGKGGDRTRLFDTVRKIKQQYGNHVNLHGSFIYGLPHESLASLQETTDFLMSDQNPLDSWRVNALSIRPNNQTYSNDFLSDLDKNYAKYGYSVIGNAPASRGSIYTLDRLEQGQMIWKNEHTNRSEMIKMAEDIYQKSQAIQNNISGQSAFGIAGLGVDLSTSFNKKITEVDWHELDKKKMQRMIAYKNLVFEKLEIPKIQNINHSTETFSEWLISQA
tara:strand:- start:368 stop:2014 length:1647 start_codon:yes stop_codon:yes gene_type:complete